MSARASNGHQKQRLCPASQRAPHPCSASADAVLRRAKHTILKVGPRQIGELLQVQVNQKRKKGCVSVCVGVCDDEIYLFTSMYSIYTGGARGQICTGEIYPTQTKRQGTKSIQAMIPLLITIYTCNNIRLRTVHQYKRTAAGSCGPCRPGASQQVAMTMTKCGTSATALSRSGAILAMFSLAKSHGGNMCTTKLPCGALMLMMPAACLSCR